MYSWLRQTLTRTNNKDTHKLKTSKNPVSIVEEQDEEYYGVTNNLIEFIKTLSSDTFKTFSLPEEQIDGIPTSTSGVRVDLSDWQQHHATLILSKVKELSQLRYTLCPRHLKERQFWRIYFTLVKNHLTEYELRPIRLDKLKEMAAENDTKSSYTNEIELEMTEPKRTSKSTAP